MAKTTFSSTKNLALSSLLVFSSAFSITENEVKKEAEQWAAAKFACSYGQTLLEEMKAEKVLTDSQITHFESKVETAKKIADDADKKVEGLKADIEKAGLKEEFYYFVNSSYKDSGHTLLNPEKMWDLDQNNSDDLCIIFEVGKISTKFLRGELGFRRTIDFGTKINNPIYEKLEEFGFYTPWYRGQKFKYLTGGFGVLGLGALAWGLFHRNADKPADATDIASIKEQQKKAKANKTIAVIGGVMATLAVFVLYKSCTSGPKKKAS